MRHPSCCVIHTWYLLLAALLLLPAPQAVVATASAQGAVPAGLAGVQHEQPNGRLSLLQLPTPSAALVQSPLLAVRRLTSSQGQTGADGSSSSQLASHEAGGPSTSPDGPSRSRAAAGVGDEDAGIAGSSVGSSSSGDTPATAESSVNIRQTTQLVCNGRVMTLTVPLPPYTQVVPPFSPVYNNPPDFSCSRPNGGSCGVLLQKATCASSGINAGPANLNPDGDGTLPPDNPLLFTINPGSLRRFTFLNWTVFDVGAAGALAVGLYSDGSGQERVTHQWAPNGPQINPATGDRSCSDCSNCELGKGIKSMVLQAAPGKAGFSGFALSQASAVAGCGPGCAGTDTSFWVGLDYVCIEPTCGDVSPDTPGLQQFDCGESGGMYAFNPAEADSNLVSVEGCCLAKTCAAPDPASPGLAFDCAAFNQDPTGTRPGITCSSLPNPGSIFAPSVVTCCECVTVKQSGGDISITKLVSPGSPLRKTNKAGSTPAVAPDGLTAGAGPEALHTAAAAAAANGGSTRSSVSALRSVGTVFMFTLVVKLQGLQDDVAEFVRLQDAMPPGLLIESVVESPFEGACDVSGDASRLSCVWSRLTFMDDTRTITVQARASRAGSLLNCASVSTSSADPDLTNNESCATVRIQAACCSRLANGSPTCKDRLPGNCDKPPESSFYPESSCADSPCFVPPSTKGACCLALQGRCVQPATPGACAAAGGAYTPGALCSQVSCEWPVTGACCLGAAKQGGSTCLDEQAADACAAISGTFYSKLSCSDIGDVCTPTGSSGACCNVKAGSCRNNVPQRLCPSDYNLWLQGGKCGNGFCTGACCRSGTGSNCMQTLKSQCSGSNRWFIFAACAEVTCPVESGPGCISEWRECDPSRDTCCEGLRCQFTNPDKAARAGAYACKRQNSQCVGPGTPCGGASGNTCCSGLLCRWDYANRLGSCQPASGCAPDGAPCSSDDETCRGCRCFNGKSKAVTFQMCYGNRRCRSYSCFLNRRQNCECLHASAASL